MKKETIVYFQCNDWVPSPEAASKFIYAYLEGSLYYKEQPFDFEVVTKTTDEEHDWIKKNRLCINVDVYDQSLQYWVTTTKEWVEENFPELLPYVSEEPKDDMFKGDKKYYLKYTEENIGVFNITNWLESYEPEEFEKEKYKLIDI